MPKNTKTNTCIVPTRYDKEIETLWNMFMSAIDFRHNPPQSFDDIVQHFGSPIYIQTHFIITKEIHLIGNILAHYLTHAHPNNSRYTLDSWDVITLVWISGLTYESILDHLHNVNWILCEIERMEKAWLLFQQEVLQIKKPIPFTHIHRIKKILIWIQTQQFSRDYKIKNYNRKLVLLFRLFHGKNNPRVLPTLRWGFQNDWACGLEYLFQSGFTQRKLLSILQKNKKYDSSVFYGCWCEIKENVQYTSEVYRGVFVDHNTMEV